ncbi:dynamin family protein [Halomonas sp. Bachu 37]|uniref:dynamin family protein n=1 Tax=Halomonas kashgarensis TaxID=3084920 RepID=UPI003217B69E
MGGGDQAGSAPDGQFLFLITQLETTLAKSKVQPSAIHRQFNILILATMSAGKSSFINALIGEELLHAANEATTACITTLEHNDCSDSTSACCYAYNGDLLDSVANIQAEQLKAWNRDDRIRNIILQGNFSTYCQPSQGLVLHDTPGPNNSQDPRHAQLTMDAIRDIPFDMVFYILNATQLGTRDDRALLTTVKEELARLQRPHKVVFILNKVDQLDCEKGESLTKHVEQAFSYLVDVGYTEPTIVPMIANAALYARKKLAGMPLSRKQRIELANFRDTYLQDSGALLKASLVPAIVRKNVKKYMQFETRNVSVAPANQSELHLLMAYSGLATVVIMIDRQRATFVRAQSRKEETKHQVSA